MSLSVIEGSELCRCLVKTGVGREDRAATLSLISDDAPHNFSNWSSIPVKKSQVWCRWEFDDVPKKVEVGQARRTFSPLGIFAINGPFPFVRVSSGSHF